MDLCGPYPVQTPDGKRYFFAILDDHSNWGFTHLLRLKSEAYTSYCHSEAFLLRSFGTLVQTVRLDGALELCKLVLNDHFAKQGIVVQQTAPYAHQQAGKIERYVRTIEEGGQTLLADAGLPMSFWGWAVLTSQYLRNHLPTSTLANGFTPFEVLTGKKPDLSHLRIWGCQCFIIIPPELHTKAGPRRFKAIFVGYEEARVGWVVRDLKGAVHFSRDVIFNEDLSGRLGVSRQISSRPPSPSLPLAPVRPVRDRMLTMAGRDYAHTIHLKKLRALDRVLRKTAGPNFSSQNGGDESGGGVAGGDESVPYVDVDATNGGAVPGLPDVPASAPDLDVFPVGMGDLTPSDDVLSDIISFLAPSDFPSQVDTDSLSHHEVDIMRAHCMSGISDVPLPLTTVSSFNLSKEPFSYSEAVARPDAPVWFSAMEREKTSLKEMGAFREEDLPKGEKTIGLKWVYAYKKDANGDIIKGKEKARVVAQGFNQRPGQFDETYAPVAKMASVRILLAWAATRDLEIYQFDCKRPFYMLSSAIQSMPVLSLVTPSLLLGKSSVSWWLSMVCVNRHMNFICCSCHFSSPLA